MEPVQIMEIDELPDADMVSPNHLNQQIDYDQVMDSVQVDENQNQEIEMMDDYSTQISPEPELEPEPVILACPTNFPILDTEISRIFPVSKISEGVEVAAPIEMIEVPSDPPLLDSQDLTYQDSASLSSLPTHVSNHQESVNVSQQIDSVQDSDLKVPSRVTDLVPSEHDLESNLPCPTELAQQPKDQVQQHPTIETITSVLSTEESQIVNESSPEEPEPAPVEDGCEDENVPIEDFTGNKVVDLDVDDLLTADGSLESRPVPRIDLIEHVQIDFELIQLLDNETISPDQEPLMMRQAPCIRLICEDCEYSLFQSSSTDTKDEVVLLSEPEHQEIYFAPLDELFESLRNIFPAFAQTDHNELVLSFPDLEARIPEDNVYARDLTLFDMDRLHVGANLPGRLLVSVEKQPRLIHRFNVLAKHVWKQRPSNVNEATYPDDFQDQDELQAEIEAGASGALSLDQDEVKVIGKVEDHTEVLLNSEDGLPVESATEALDSTLNKSVTRQALCHDTDTDALEKRDESQGIPELAVQESNFPEGLSVEVGGPAGSTAPTHPNEVSVQADLSTASVPKSAHESAEAGPSSSPPSPARSAMPQSAASSKTVEDSDRSEDQAPCRSPTDATADGEELESVNYQEDTLTDPKIESSKPDEPPALGLKATTTTVHVHAVETLSSLDQLHNNDDDEVASIGTVLGHGLASDEYELEELTDEGFHKLIDTSPLLQTFPPPPISHTHITLARSSQRKDGTEETEQLPFLSAKIVNEPRISGLVSTYELSTRSDLKKRPAEVEESFDATEEQDLDTKRMRKC
ncbi:hypothetical protein CROQUDRAFT_672704 [Cronartium quercuum f. sp. fusiforme G11]|uniref:Uncharacterized protein n=1 Tax=Cronartium quercuum f. sp. fusiforme G11 TaxID=708437 RepID=A0A9P6NGR8_9BASI|nr:hypothetical protein CROQUDRAFT_672704 [Cronartium quercuum f. sp. fusiforme G11]